MLLQHVSKQSKANMCTRPLPCSVACCMLPVVVLLLSASQNKGTLNPVARVASVAEPPELPWQAVRSVLKAAFARIKDLPHSS